MTGAHAGTGSRTQRGPGRAPPRRRPPRAGLLSGWQRHQDLLRNASSLVATTGVASVLGFAYWALAARLFSQQAVGYGSAAVSAMTLLGTVGMLGLGTVLIGELPRRKARAGLISAALVTCGAGSLILGVAFALAAPQASTRFADISGTAGRLALFAVGVSLTGVTLVFDQAAIGLMRGGLQLSRNSVFAAVKLLALPATAVILHDEFGTGIAASWVAGTALSLAVVAVRLRQKGSPVLARPDWDVLRGLGRTAMAHNWLNLAITVPRSLIPVLVTVIISPAANAAFYAAWTLSGFLYIVPTHLSTVLFALAAADPKVIARKLRVSLRLSTLIGLAGMAVLGAGAHLALSLFGASYARAATVTLWLLVIGYVPAVFKVHYIAVCRASGRIPRAAAVLTLAAVAEVAAVAVGGAAGHLDGVAIALLAVFAAEGLVTAPAVIRAAIGHGGHRRPESNSVNRR
jgi:O-antigen/teichoic acid export membrane protein